MSQKLPYACRLCKNFLNLEKDSFNYGFDKRNETTFLLCHPCKNDLDRITKREISEEEFRKSVRRRWEEGRLKEQQKIEEVKKQGWEVETIPFGGESPETISCDQLVKWFSKLEGEKKAPRHSNLLVILSNLERKGKLCSNCLRFRNKLQKKMSNNSNNK